MEICFWTLYLDVTLCFLFYFPWCSNEILWWWAMIVLWLFFCPKRQTLVCPHAKSGAPCLAPELARMTGAALVSRLKSLYQEDGGRSVTMAMFLSDREWLSTTCLASFLACTLTHWHFLFWPLLTFISFSAWFSVYADLSTCSPRCLQGVAVRCRPCLVWII